MHPTFNNINSNPSPTNSSRIVTNGAMSFDSDMHGNTQPMKLVSDLPEDDSSFVNLSKATSIKIASLQAKLNQQLGPEYISTRPGPGGGPKLVYAEGWKIINLANEVFGFNGWSSNLVSLTTDFIDYNEETRRYSVGVTAILRVTLRDGVFHEDIGYGILENSKTKGPALDKCKKEAVTDALKRSLRNFGNLLGNCLYDKQYTNEIIKIKVPPENLHRRPEFSTDMNKAAPSPATNNTSKPVTSGSTATKVNTTPSAVKSEPAPCKAISSIPHHVREQVRLSLQESSSSTTPPNPPRPDISATKSDILPNVTTPTAGPSNRGSAVRHAAIIHGLNTPITTPAALQPIPRLIPPQQAQDTPNHRQVVFADSPLANKVTAVANTLHAPGESLDDVGAGDDSFALGSEDDAFFASVDLGNADIGRPIDFEEGSGNGGNQKRGQNHLSTSASHQNNIQSTRLNPASSSSSATSSSAMTHNSSKVLPPLHPHKDGQRNQILPHQAQRPVLIASKGSDAPDRQTHPNAILSDTARDSTNVVATSTPASRRMGGFSFPPDLASLD
ncbi:Rad52/22 family double-strand break repair protein-domain-containing protein [Lentinula novae-zelandiae]|nr:Rad52/22 family double-strand break repair protein-domain-containing protein [Lentinula novae-zelandiae]